MLTAALKGSIVPNGHIWVCRATHFTSRNTYCFGSSAGYYRRLQALSGAQSGNSSVAGLGCGTGSPEAWATRSSRPYSIGSTTGRKRCSVEFLVSPVGESQDLRISEQGHTICSAKVYLLGSRSWHVYWALVRHRMLEDEHQITICPQMPILSWI